MLCHGHHLGLRQPHRLQQWGSPRAKIHLVRVGLIRRGLTCLRTLRCEILRRPLVCNDVRALRHRLDCRVPLRQNRLAVGTGGDANMFLLQLPFPRSMPSVLLIVIRASWLKSQYRVRD